jgi:hypothetical protein
MDGEEEPMAAGTPLRCGQDLLGTVILEGGSPGSYSGVFVPGPDFESYRPLFEHVFKQKQRVDGAADSEYQAAWYDWHQALEAIERLGLTFGAERIPVEDFEVDDDWQVRFQTALWWVATTDNEPEDTQGTVVPDGR